MATMSDPARPPLLRWQIRYVAIPTAHHRSQNAIIEAETAEDARALLLDALGEGNGVTNYVVQPAVPYAPPAVRGRIVTLREEA
jgi:hypothetical protein